MLLVVLVATLAGFVGVSVINRPESRAASHMVALTQIMVGAFLQSRGTNLTRPQDVLLAQGLVAFGGANFLPPAAGWSFAHTPRWGIQHLTSFFEVFLASQNLDGLLGSAALGTLVTVREKFHSNRIVESLTADPLVAQRIRQYGVTYAHVIGDPALRGAEGTAPLAQAATREAYVLAYNDLFLAVAVVSAFGLLGLVIHQIIARFGRGGAAGREQAA